MEKYDKEEVLDQWQACEDAYSDLYSSCKADWKFLQGSNQWEDKDENKRRKQGRPCLTLNQLKPYAQQVTNDIRQARLAIRVSPVDDNADIDTAEVLQGIIRNIEIQSNAKMAYATAAMNAIGAGLGWIHVETDYADNESFDQEIYIDRVLDFASVYLDPQCESIDGSDAEYAFIRKDYTKERFAELWPDREPISFDDQDTRDEEICVVTYYKKCYTKDTLYQVALPDGSIQVINQEAKEALDSHNDAVEKEDEENIQLAPDGTSLPRSGYEVMAQREVELPYVKKCLLNGEDEPLDETEFPSDYIPLVLVVGDEVYIDGKREFHSLIRQAKDSQRLYNYWKSYDAETVALQPKAPTIGPKGSFKSYPNKWKNANTENIATLEYDIVYDKNGMPMPAPTRQPPITGSPTLMQAAEMAKQDIRLSIGMPLANMGERGNEVSGIAIRNRQIEGDNATFHFVDNLAASLTHLGRILVDMIPRLYSERKITRILGENDEPENVPINTPFVEDENGKRAARRGEKYTGIYDISAGKYDVVCDIGPSYSSQRQEMADKLVELLQARPDLADVAGDLMFEALDIPMGKEIANRIKATLDPSILGDDPQAAQLQKAADTLKQMQEQLANYEVVLADKSKNEKFEQEYKLQELENDRAKIEINARKTAAEIEKMRAETQGFRMEAVNEVTDTIAGLSEQMDDITETIGIMLDAKEREANQETSEPVTSDASLNEDETNE